jgi:transposase InsO family protein
MNRIGICLRKPVESETQNRPARLCAFQWGESIGETTYFLRGHPFEVRGCPAYPRSENSSQFTAARVRRFLEDLGVDTLLTEPGSPWENGHVESFNR